MNNIGRSETVLAVYPTSRGFGFIVMRSPLSPIDWGTQRVNKRHKNAHCLEKISALIDSHLPDVLILEDPTALGSKSRPKRIADLSRGIAKLADAQGIDVHAYPRARVKELFATFGTRTRYDTAMVIAKQITALERFLPSRRRTWENESPRMAIFNAAALAVTYFSVAE